MAADASYARRSLGTVQGLKGHKRLCLLCLGLSAFTFLSPGLAQTGAPRRPLIHNLDINPFQTQTLWMHFLGCTMMRASPWMHNLNINSFQTSNPAAD
eukprot:362795-Chlamydomonas_euryale.AAC.4